MHPKRLAGTLALAALAALLAPGAGAGSPALAQDAGAGAPSPEEVYRTRLRETMPQVAAKFETAANYAMRNKLKRTGLNVYQMMLEFDPGNDRARRELGFDRKGDEWVANDSKQKKLDEVEDESVKKLGDFEKHLRDAQVAASRMLAALAEAAEQAGLEDRAREHLKKALFLDDQNAQANQKMGNRLVDGKWYTQRALNHREFRKVYASTLDKARKMGVAPVPADESTGIAEAAGINIRRYRTTNFRVESNLPDADIRETLVWLERARTFYLELFEVPERLLAYDRDPLVFVIVTTPEQKDKLIDACGEIPADRKAFNKRFTAVKVNNKLDIRMERNGESAQRHCIHTGTHTMVRDTFGGHAPWLSEALANAVSAALKGADLSVCFSGEGSTGGIHLERISLDQAPTLLRELILARKDTPIGEFVKLPSDAMTAQQIAKSWSIVMFLLERDRLQAREYYAAAGQGQGGERSKDDRVLKQYFEDLTSWETLDAIWREWALDVYKN